MSNKEKRPNNEFEQEKVNEVWQRVWVSRNI